MAQNPQPNQQTNPMPPPPPLAPMSGLPEQKTDVLGILSIVFIFIATPIGLILGLIGSSQAKKEGRSPTLSKVGWIINLILTLLAVAGVILLIVFAMVGSANDKARNSSSGSSSNLQSDTTFSKGETGHFGDFDVKIDNVTRNYIPADTYDKAGTGKELIVLDITVKNVSKDSQYISPYDFGVEDGAVQVTPTYVDPPATKFSGGNLISGGSSSGQLVFEINANDTGLQLVQKATVHDSKYNYSDVTYKLAF